MFKTFSKLSENRTSGIRFCFSGLRNPVVFLFAVLMLPKIGVWFEAQDVAALSPARQWKQETAYTLGIRLSFSLSDIPAAAQQTISPTQDNLPVDFGAGEMSTIPFPREQMEKFNY